MKTVYNKTKVAAGYRAVTALKAMLKRYAGQVSACPVSCKYLEDIHTFLISDF
jgi:hypothetical protein